MAYGIMCDEFKAELEEILNKKYKDKRVRVTKNEIVGRGYEGVSEYVPHEGRCIGITVRPIASNYVSDNPYGIFIKLIHNDLKQSKEWLQLNESKIEILD